MAHAAACPGEAAGVTLHRLEPGAVDWLTAKKIEIVPVSCPDTMTPGCNVMAPGKGRILSTADNKDLDARLKAQGFEVYAPDVSLFARGGGVRCMAQPLRRDAV